MNCRGAYTHGATGLEVAVSGAASTQDHEIAERAAAAVSG